MKTGGAALSAFGSRSGRVSSILVTDCTWEGSLSVFPATEADDSATPAGQVEGTMTILPVTSVELKSLFNSFLTR